jgi:GT2 family glycosyltransferase
MKQIDIFIVNFFSAADTAGAIAKLGANPLWDFWVIDNSNDPVAWAALQDAIAATGILVHLEKAPENLGFGNACNALYRLTKGPYCLLLNPDAQIEADALISLHRQLQENIQFAALAPMMRWIEGEAWWIPMATAQTVLHQVYQSLIGLHPWLLKTAWQRYYRKQCNLLHHAGIVRQSFVSGAILLLRRSAIAHISGHASQLFDPRYFMFFEDADLSRRIRRGGYLLGIATQVQASHLYQHSANKHELMQASFQQYEACHESTWLLRLKSWWLQQVQPHQQRLQPSALDIGLSSLGALNAALGQRTLIAWSPAPNRIPAIWRTHAHATTPGFSNEAWGHLSPGHYYGVAKDPQGKLSWIEFDRY